MNILFEEKFMRSSDEEAHATYLSGSAREYCGRTPR